jgi:hypothetical protein
MKYFVRDSNNVYIGTEPERIWTEEDLEAIFGVRQNASAPRWKMSSEEGRVFIVEDEEYHDEKLECL